MAALRLLLVEDSEDDVLLLQRELQRGRLGAQITRVADDTALRDLLASMTFDAVLVDWDVPGLVTSDVLAMLAAHDPDLPVILISGVLREEEAVEALRSGARDFIVKERLSRLVPAIEREVAGAKQRRDDRALREHVAVVERLACVGVLARGLVHDLNGGLSVVLTNVDLVRSELPPGDLADALEDARGAAMQLVDTIAAVRAFTTVDEDRTPVDARRVLRGALRLVEVSLRPDLVVEIEDVPLVDASEALLVQLFYTLLLVAVGERRDRRPAAIKVRLDAPLGAVRLRVGPIQPTKALERAVREALCRRLVVEIGGSVDVEVDSASGASVWSVTIRGVARAATEPPRVAAAERQDLANVHVLVVDDDPILGRTLTRLLRPARVKVVSDANKALDVIKRQGPFDAILCDVMMGPIDGVRFLELLRGVAPAQADHFAFLTASVDVDRVERSFPGITVLQKPFERARLREVVGSIARS